jgi:hypothetical protein
MLREKDVKEQGRPQDEDVKGKKHTHESGAEHLLKRNSLESWPGGQVEIMGAGR